MPGLLLCRTFRLAPARGHVVHEIGITSARFAGARLGPLDTFRTELGLWFRALFRFGLRSIPRCWSVSRHDLNRFSKPDWSTWLPDKSREMPDLQIDAFIASSGLLSKRAHGLLRHLNLRSRRREAKKTSG